ncbi:hypothetical protein SFUMM280S_07415 [Streptomyces fumanus]
MTQLGRVATHALHGAEQDRGPLELLEGEQPQRVAHEDGDAPAVGTLADAAQEGGQGDQTEISLRLATAGGEPEQVGDLPVVVLRIVDAGHAEQHESDLEGAPVAGGRVGGAHASALHPGAAGALIGHGAVGEPERLHQVRFRPQQLDALADPTEGLATGPDLVQRGLCVSAAHQRVRLGRLPVDPVPVIRGESFEGGQDLRVGILGQAQHGQRRAVDLRVGVGEQYLHARHELAPYLGDGGRPGVGHADRRRSPVPGSSAAVSDGAGRGVLVQRRLVAISGSWAAAGAGRSTNAEAPLTARTVRPHWNREKAS